MPEKIRVWDLPVRVFHWLLAGSFAIAYMIAESRSLRSAHMILGYTATGLIAFRIVWGFVGSRFARWNSFLYPPRAAIRYLQSLFYGSPQRFLGHSPAGGYAIFAILLLGLATGVTGYLKVNEIGGESMEDIHAALANIWLGVVILHIAGVALSSWTHRENLVRAMVTGYKQSTGAPTDDAQPGVPVSRGVGIALGAAVAGFWIWSLLTGTVPGAAGSATDKESVSPAPDATEQRGQVEAGGAIAKKRNDDS